MTRGWCIVSKRQCENSSFRNGDFLFGNLFVFGMCLGDVLFVKSCWCSKICGNIVLGNLKKIGMQWM